MVIAMQILKLKLIDQKYFLPRVHIRNYNIEVDGRNFYDQPTND